MSATDIPNWAVKEYITKEVLQIFYNGMLFFPELVEM